MVAGATDFSLATKWRVTARPAAPSGKLELALDVTLPEGWHVNAHDPDRDFLIPTTLNLEPPSGVRVSDIRYPEPVVRRLAFAEGAPLRLYEGTFPIVVTLEGPASGRLAGSLRYQACTDETCLPPRKEAVTFVLDAESPAAGVGSGGWDFASWRRDYGLLPTLGLAMIVGLALNLTPCVYPLISVTVGYFGGQAGASRGRTALLAVTYVLGIAITFSTLGVTAALSGELFGAALQQPAVLIGLALLMAALAASNFGLYQFRMPSMLTRVAGRASAGVAGALAMGLTMGVVAAPCIGPGLVALLLLVAARQDALLGFALFFAVAVGMGAPYVVLAMAAGSIRALPRSGAWLQWVEHLFGFLLLGLALYFVSPVLGNDVSRVAFVLLIAVGGFTLGFLERPAAAARGFVALQRALGAGALLFAAALALPGPGESTVTWQPFTPDALAAAHAAGKPAIVDFTASWCLPCRENDAVTFTDEAVGAAARRFVMLRADVTEANDRVDDWMQRYAIRGVPTIIFYSPAGAEAARVVGFVEPSRFLSLMEAPT
jgi:thiol:disulfide interchange protein DsbD